MVDRLSPGEIDNYHKYRKKKMKHLYICKECAHGFDRETPVSKCIFCGGVVKELQRDDIPSSKPLVRYTCTACDKIFIKEHADKCPRCGSKFLHFYQVRNISTKEVLSMRKSQLKEKLKLLAKARVKKK